jgi:putative hemolysin
MDILVSQSIGFFIALCSTALFSYLETTITAIRFFKIRELAQTTPRYHTILTILEEQPHRILVTILIACNLSNVIAAALSTSIMEELFSRLNWSEGLGFSSGIIIATLAILIFGEIIPKNFAKLHGERFFGSILWFLNAVYVILYPIVKLLLAINNFILGNQNMQNGTHITSEKEIRFLIDYINQKGLMEHDKSAMLLNIFRICSKQLKGILIPLPDMVTIEAHSSIEQALKIFIKYQFSRLPVYDTKENNIVGILYQKDVFEHMQSGEFTKQITTIMRPATFFPESTKINHALKNFKDQRVHMAIILNEYGAITGLVTLEDVLEEIVGEIKDEHEPDDDNIISLSNGTWLIAGSTPLDEVSALLNIPFEVETAVTIGGFLIERMQHVPQKGERLEYNGIVFQVQSATPRRLLKVLIFKKDIHE